MNNTTVPHGNIEYTDQEIISHAVQTLAGDNEQWCLWRYEEREDGGKQTKMPITRGNAYASVSDTTTWLPYEEVKTAYNETEEYNGIGLMFDGSFVGVDLDHCVEDGVITDPLVEAFVSLAGTYTEISPSGTGLHLYFKLSRPTQLPNKKKGPYEVYITSRYFTFTGNLFCQNLVRTLSPEEVEQLLKALGYPWSPVQTAVDRVVSGSSQNLDLEIVKQKMFSSSNGPALEALYNGDTSEYSNDNSVADAAFVKNTAYWTDNNPEAMRSLWLESPLGQREKTQKRPDYVERTLGLALLDSSSSNTDLVQETSTSNTSYHKTKAMSPREVFAKEELDLEDLLKLELKTEWDVEQLITKGSLNMIASPPHQGKTFMALHIAVCIANGLPVFGKFKVDESKNVMIVNEEDVLADIKGRLESMVPEKRTGKHIKLYANTGIKVSDEWAEGLLERAKVNQTGLIILDSLGALSLANENESHAMYQVMDCFRRFVNEGITVIFIHHDRKGQSAEVNTGSAMDRARGSGAISAAVHGYLSIKELPDKQFKVEQVKLKANIAKVKPFVIQMHHTLTPEAKFRYDFEYVGEYNPDQTAAEGIEGRVLQLCQKHGEDFLFTRKVLVEHKLANSPEDKTLRQSLKWMVTKGLLESQSYSSLSDKQKKVVVGGVVPANTLVYWASEKALVASEEDDVDDLNIPF